MIPFCMYFDPNCDRQDRKWKYKGWIGRNWIEFLYFHIEPVWQRSIPIIWHSLENWSRNRLLLLLTWERPPAGMAIELVDSGIQPRGRIRNIHRRKFPAMRPLSNFLVLKYSNDLLTLGITKSKICNSEAALRMHRTLSRQFWLNVGI